MTNKGKNGILWFRNDLRLRDNESLIDALNSCDNIIPVYIYDDRIHEVRGEYGYERMGPHRKRFLKESLISLRKNLVELGSNLIIRRGNTEDIIYDICKQTKSSLLFCNRERTREELEVQNLTEERIWTLGAEMRYNRGKMLYYTADLPFPITHAPDSFASFRKEVEKYIEIREPFKAPDHIPSRISYLEPGEVDIIPETYSKLNESSDCSPIFFGGEYYAIERLHQFMSGDISIDEKYHLEDSGTLLSPYLSKGCISPKQVFFTLNKMKNRLVNKHENTKILLNLMLRDYHRLMAKKYRKEYFELNGIKSWDKNVDFDLITHKKWIRGETDEPLINALMSELNCVGFIPHHARQIVAQYYIYEMNMPWKSGAEYFEYILIDHDPASNYGNWRQIANQTPDEIEYKPYSLEHYREKYYPDEEFINYWVGRKGKQPAVAMEPSS